MRSKTKNTTAVLDNINIDFVIQQEVDKIIDEIEENVNVIAFCEDSYYLNQPLHPVERVILKVYYGVELDSEIPIIQCRDFPHDSKGKWFTEKQYIEFLIKQKRINVDTIEELNNDITKVTIEEISKEDVFLELL